MSKFEDQKQRQLSARGYIASIGRFSKRHSLLLHIIRFLGISIEATPKISKYDWEMSAGHPHKVWCRFQALSHLAMWIAYISTVLVQPRSNHQLVIYQVTSKLYPLIYESPTISTINHALLRTAQCSVGVWAVQATPDSPRAGVGVWPTIGIQPSGTQQPTAMMIITTNKRFQLRTMGTIANNNAIPTIPKYSKILILCHKTQPTIGFHPTTRRIVTNAKMNNNQQYWDY